MFCQRLRTSIKFKNIIGYNNEFIHPIICKQCKNEDLQLPRISNFCTQKLPNNANIFGDISGRQFEHVKMDELEQKEENFQDTEARIPRRLKPSLGQYARMIKSHASKNDLNSALKVLDLMKDNRDKPTIYLYNLLLRNFAMHGDVKQCFSLYNNAKKRGLKPDGATYTSLFNACATSKKSAVALEYLNKLRRSLYEQQFPLNRTHYNAMMKAYSWQNQIVEAFQLADEMNDKKIYIGESTYNSLFHGAISDKESGLRHALIVWHLMHLKKIKLSLTTYNLFLRAIRDTNLGNLKLDDTLISGLAETKILLKEGERPDLLASPPVLNTLLLSAGKEQNIMQYNVDAMRQEGLINLNDILINNRLILFGGVEGFLNRMINNGVKPDIKTITLLLDLVPNSVSVENLLLKIADDNGVELDIGFFNALIKKRSMRFDYKAAKETISMAERRRLSPDVMTFGVLAIGCRQYSDAAELLKGIETFGYKPNTIIMSTLINAAYHKKDLQYLLFVMNYMTENNIRPNLQAIKTLETFSKELPKMEKPTGKYRRRKLERLKENVEKFEQQYPKWQNIIKKRSDTK